ncbi:hypothetical protein D046_3372, partial [Vibrio parahaemolyticus V-223/04]
FPSPKLVQNLGSRKHRNRYRDK